MLAGTSLNPASAKCGQNRNTRGFTLVELLVSLTLLSLIAVLIVMAINGARIAKVRLEERSETARVLAVKRLLRRIISETNAVLRDPRQPEKYVYFEGTSKRLTLISSHTTAGQYGGLYVSKIIGDERAQSNSKDLTMHQSLLRRSKSAVQTQQSSSNTRPLLKKIENVRFRYFGKRLGQRTATWSNRWQQSRNLPRLVEMTVLFGANDHRKWLPITVTLEVGQN